MDGVPYQFGDCFFGSFFQSRTRSAFSHQKLRQSQRHGAPLLTKNLGNQHTAPAENKRRGGFSSHHRIRSAIRVKFDVVVDGELIREIQSLASAIQSDADLRNRAARAVRNAAAGRVVTDDAMDFLKRQKMKMKEEENENKDKEEEGVCVGGGGMNEGRAAAVRGRRRPGVELWASASSEEMPIAEGGGGTTGQTRDSPSSPRCSWRCRAICWRSGIASSRPGDARKSGRRGAATMTGTEGGGPKAEAKATTSRDRHRPGTVV